MVFVIEEKPHTIFKREGDDLVYNFQVPLVDALTGPDGGGTPGRSISHLDGRTINFNIPYPRGGGAPLKPGQVIRVANEVSIFELVYSVSFESLTDESRFVHRVCLSLARTHRKRRETS